MPDASRPPIHDPASPAITARIAAELIAHEGIVPEAYRDSAGVWTWSVGVTDASGHKVGRYRDAPQPLSRCLEVYLWLLRTRYLPPLLRAFGDHRPQEHELAAALSFHWNTGAIGRAEWMRLFREGDVAGARRAMMNWCRPASLTRRRRCERALFFDGRWSNDGTALVYDVAKPGYRPCAARRVPIIATLESLIDAEAGSRGAAAAIAAIAAPAEATSPQPPESAQRKVAAEANGGEAPPTPMPHAPARPRACSPERPL